MRFSMISSRMIQAASGSASLPDPVDLETEEQELERGKYEHDVLDLAALGEYKCDRGMSVENVHVEGTIYCSQVLYGVADGGGEECGKEEEYCRPVRNVLLDSKTKQGISHG